MPYLLAVAAAVLVFPAVALGLLAVALAVVAGVFVFACAASLGATGCLLRWILALTAAGVAWPTVHVWRRAVRRVRNALATAGPGIGRPRGG